MPSIATRPNLPEEDQARAEHQSLRTRMGNGTWAEDLERALAKHIAPDRRTAWGLPELSRNPHRALSTQIGGALYASAPLVRGPAGGEALIRAVEDAGYWQLMQRFSTDLVSLREGIMRVDWSERGGLLYRPAPVECCVVDAHPLAPDAPARIAEVQIRQDPGTGKDAWCWEVLDVYDLAAPRHRILSGDRKQDWTAAFVPPEYQYLDAAERPFIPAAMYHAERTGKIWDPYYGIEAVLGSLTVGVLLTFWVHGVKDGSFATVLLIGGKVVGLEVRSPSGATTNVISTEPGSLIEITSSEEGIQPTAIQLQPGCDPEKLMNAIGAFEGGLAQYAGVSPADLVRTGADPRSGASLSISREGLRAAQARYAPQLRRGDLEVLSITAKVLNRATGTNYPESGYAISYPALPLSAEEVKSQREDLLAKVGAGLMSKVDAYMRLTPGLTREQAIEDLQRIARENAMFPGPTLTVAPTLAISPTGPGAF